MGFRPGQPNEMFSEVPFHVTSVPTITAAAITSVRRRGMLRWIFSFRRFWRHSGTLAQPSAV
jgi:hypothetical protein